MTKKYGKPKKDESVWDNNLYKNDPSKWGYAVSKGHLHFKSVWDTDLTLIVLHLKGDDSEINCAINYLSKELKHLLNRDKTKEIESIF